jgi:hypothetical protein
MFDLVPDDELNAKKREFARHLIKRPNEAFKAAAFIYPDKANTGNRLIVAHDWPDDPIVIMEMDRLVWDDDASKVLPTKSQLAFEVYSVGMKTYDDEVKIKAFKLYADIQAITQAGPGININNNNGVKLTTQNTVMLVKDHGSDKEWENKLSIQQQKLLNTDVDKPFEDAVVIDNKQEVIKERIRELTVRK